MKSAINDFYRSAQWKACREGFIKSRKGLCERCKGNGRIEPGTQVHHKTRINADNLHDANITLNWENLELLCDECHEKEHGKHKQRADADGHVEI